MALRRGIYWFLRLLWEMGLGRGWGRGKMGKLLLFVYFIEVLGELGVLGFGIKWKNICLYLLVVLVLG